MIFWWWWWVPPLTPTMDWEEEIYHLDTKFTSLKIIRYSAKLGSYSLIHKRISRISKGINTWYNRNTKLYSTRYKIYLIICRNLAEEYPQRYVSKSFTVNGLKTGQGAAKVKNWWKYKMSNLRWSPLYDLACVPVRKSIASWWTTQIIILVIFRKMPNYDSLLPLFQSFSPISMRNPFEVVVWSV